MFCQHHVGGACTTTYTWNAPPQHCVWWIPGFVLDQIYLFNILLLHGQTFWWQLCIYRSMNTRRRFGEHEGSVARGAKVFPWAATTLVFWWTVIPIWKTRMSWFFFNSYDENNLENKLWSYETGGHGNIFFPFFFFVYYRNRSLKS